MVRMQIIILLLSIVLAPVSCGGGDNGEEHPEPPPPTAESPRSAPPTERVVGPLNPEDARALATMNDRIIQYVELHIRVEQTLPKLPEEATPEQIDNHQRALEKLLREARAKAKPGDIFTAEARQVIKRLLAQVFSGPEGKELRSSIMDENPVDPSTIRLTVNSRYPDTVPLATVPPQVLQALPELSEDLEYRFVGDWLILLDTHAHIVADYIGNALPE